MFKHLVKSIVLYSYRQAAIAFHKYLCKNCGTLGISMQPSHQPRMIYWPTEHFDIVVFCCVPVDGTTYIEWNIHIYIHYLYPL